MQSLSIVIPCFNEVERLPTTLDRIARFVRDRKISSDVLVVDDGSQDGTADVAESTARRLDLPCRVLRHAPNRGKGFAVRGGFREAKGDRVLLSDADLSVPIEFAEPFLARLDDDVDAVFGSRRMPGAEIAVHQPWLRERMGVAFHALARLGFALRSTDFTCGFKLFRRDAAARIAALQRVWGWGYDVELRVIARRLGLRVVEEPVSWTDDRRTRVRLARDVARSATDLVRIGWHDLRGRYGSEREPWPATAAEPSRPSSSSLNGP